MTSTAPAQRRPVAPTKDAFGMKALIMLTSVVITLGGWALLAARQAMDVLPASTAAAAAQPALSSNPGSPAPSLRQVTVPQTQLRPAARTRSSR